MDFTRLTSQFEYLRGFVFFEKRQQISTVAKLRILTNDKRIKGILTLRNEFHENSRFFLAQREYYLVTGVLTDHLRKFIS